MCVHVFFFLCGLEIIAVIMEFICDRRVVVSEVILDGLDTMDAI